MLTTLDLRNIFGHLEIVGLKRTSRLQIFWKWFLKFFERETYGDFLEILKEILREKRVLKERFFLKRKKK